jgi:7,8-dihydropterin-6-yl-methyl-4-(beta-D-ribofuranosyl)aminobenzene 5'-phosphate synthase
MDTGGGDFTAAINAQRLGKDLSTVNKIVLSDGHGDHTGGLVPILNRIRKPVEIIAHPAIWSLKYTKRPNEPERFAGIRFRSEVLESMGANFNLTSEPVEITNNIMTTGEIEMQTDFEKIPDYFVIKRDGELQRDMIPEDQALCIRDDEGLAVITVCAHRGIINILRHAQKITGVDRIHTVIGGTHLLQTSDEGLKSTTDELKALDLQRLGVSHCTGDLAAARLAHEFGDLFFLNKAGTSFVLE